MPAPKEPFQNPASDSNYSDKHIAQQKKPINSCQKRDELPVHRHSTVQLATVMSTFQQKC